MTRLANFLVRGEPEGDVVGVGVKGKEWARAERGRGVRGDWRWPERLSPASAGALSRITDDFSMAARRGWLGKERFWLWRLSPVLALWSSKGGSTSQAEDNRMA